MRKYSDGRTTLSAERPDGSRTWAPQVPGFGARHDLAHYVVETTLGFRNGFYGLLAQGWEITTFEDRGIARLLPADALIAEAVVGLLLVDADQTHPVDVDEFNAMVDQSLELAGRTERRHITPQELTEFRAELAQLESRWDAVPLGAVLTLDVHLPPAAP